jgi:GT2 family glycosyltransferase
MSSNYSVVIVTHNSQKHIHKCLAALEAQTCQPARIVISDSGSQTLDYLQSYSTQPHITLITNPKDIGFCRGNNAAVPHIAPESAFVLFLNPDCFLTPTFAEQALDILNEPIHARVGALSGPLYGYDIDTDMPTGRYDSTGIFRTWYGHWYDRGQGQPIDPTLYQTLEEVPALCGALMFCRRQAIQDVVLRQTDVWDSTFYMYKDDIDLCIRMRRKGWKLLYSPSCIAYHCRGWQVNRRKMQRAYRLMSARNEIRVNVGDCWIGLPYSVTKYLAVRLLNV